MKEKSENKIKNEKNKESKIENINIQTYSGKTISFPEFYDEELNKKINKKTKEKIKKEEILNVEKFEIDTKKIFASFLDVYKYLEEVSNFINLNLKTFDEKLLRKIVKNEKTEKNEKTDIEKLNKEYRAFFDTTYEKLEKVEIYLSLRRKLNISNKNVHINNEKIAEDVLVLKREIYQFARKIIKLKEDLDEKDQANNEKKKDNKKDNKTNKKLLNEKINVFYKNMNELRHLKRLNELSNSSKETNEEKYKSLLKENALTYISIYKLFALDENLFSKNFGKDEEISLEEIKDILSKVFNSENLKEFNDIKKKINNKTKENIKDLNKEQIKEKEIKEKEVKEEQVFPNEAEEIVKNVSKYFGEDFEFKMQNIFNNNQIDFFRSNDKTSENTTIGLDKGYILLQNTKNKVDLFTFVHELGHLMRYTYVKKDIAINFIEESLAISFEFLLLDILLNDEKLKFKFEDQINDAVLSFLSKTFDTIECFLFQESVLEEIKKNKINESDKESEDSKDSEILKNVVSKRKEVLRKMGYKNLERKSYNFVLSYSYLKPYYSLNYSLGVFIGFELFCKFKENLNSENLEFFKNEKLDLKNVLNFLGKESIEGLIDVQKLFKYFLKILNDK